MFPTVDLGPVVLPSAGLVIILGIWLTLTTVERAAARLHLHVPSTYSLVVVGLAVGALAARLVFVAQHWRAYSQYPLSIIWPLTTGFNIGAGLVVGAAAAFFYARAKNLPPARTLDALAPALLVGLIAVSLSDFLAGPGYGTETQVPWQIDLFGIPRHPVQIYEIAIGLLALFVWWFLTARPPRPGQPFLVSTAIYSAGRLFTDAFRENAWLTDGGYHVVQIVALASLFFSLLLLMRFSEQDIEAPALNGPLQNN